METTDYCFSFFRKPIQNIKPIKGGRYCGCIVLSSDIMRNLEAKLRLMQSYSRSQKI